MQMPHKAGPVPVVSLLLAVAVSSAPSSPGFLVERWSFDGAGVGRSTAATVSAVQSLGQPDATGVLRSARFAVVGGFHAPVDAPGPLPTPIFANGFEAGAP